MAIKEEPAVSFVNISNESALSPVSQPESDAIKMFVGQIPRAWQEQDLIKLFQDFGPIHSINILRDKKSGESRGEHSFYSFPIFTYSRIVTSDSLELTPKTCCQLLILEICVGIRIFCF